jgi:pimeloyl-ACP methyl ester carboxylesterase
LEERRLAVAQGWLLGTLVGYGSGLPVVFVHGVAGNHHVFDPQLNELRGRRRVLAFDQRGCGGSADAPGNDYGLETRVQDLGALLDAARFDPVVLVGQGTGSQVVARSAERNLDRVRGLVLINPVSEDRAAAQMIDLSDTELQAAVEKWMREQLSSTDAETLSQMLAAERATRPLAMREMLRDGASSVLSESLARYPGPVLFIVAPEARVPPTKPGFTVLRLSREGHWSTLDAPNDVNEALRGFLQPLDAAVPTRRGPGR